MVTLICRLGSFALIVKKTNCSPFFACLFLLFLLTHHIQYFVFPVVSQDLYHFVFSLLALLPTFFLLYLLVTFRFVFDFVFLCFLVEALLVDDGCAVLVVLALANPHVGEGRERRENRATDPDGVLALRWCDDTWLKTSWAGGSHFLRQTLSHAWEHGRATRQDDVGVQVLAHVDIALADRLGDEAWIAVRITETNQVRLEERLWATEALRLDRDD